MTTIQILVRVSKTFDAELPGPFRPGKRFVFSDDLVLALYDDSTPGSGLPQRRKERLGHAFGIRDLAGNRQAKRWLLSARQQSLRVRRHVHELEARAISKRRDA